MRIRVLFHFENGSFITLRRVYSSSQGCPKMGLHFNSFATFSGEAETNIGRSIFFFARHDLKQAPNICLINERLIFAIYFLFDFIYAQFSLLLHPNKFKRASKQTRNLNWIADSLDGKPIRINYFCHCMLFFFHRWGLKP